MADKKAERKQADSPTEKLTGRLDPVLLLGLGVALTTAGMVLIVTGVIVGALFLPGVIVVTSGQVLCALAGLLHATTRDVGTRRA